jgi:hypothetical protein
MGGISLDKNFGRSSAACTETGIAEGKGAELARHFSEMLIDWLVRVGRDVDLLIRTQREASDHLHNQNISAIIIITSRQ